MTSYIGFLQEITFRAKGGWIIVFGNGVRDDVRSLSKDGTNDPFCPDLETLVVLFWPVLL